MNLILTPEMEEKLRNPRPGSKVEVAIKSGVDIERLIAHLKLTPQERIERLQLEINTFEEGKHKKLEKPFLTAASLCGEPLADFTISFVEGVDYVKATNILNSLAEDLFVYETPWYNQSELRIAVARKPTLKRLFGWEIIRVKSQDYELYFWETKTEANKFPAGLENTIENMGLSQPGADDEGQPYQ